MKVDELKNDKELSKLLDDELRELTGGKKPDAEMIIEVLKKHDIEFDEDIVRGNIVKMLEMDDDALKNVSGGEPHYSDSHNRDDIEIENFCMGIHSCYVALMHNTDGGIRDACFSDYMCVIFAN